MATWPHPLYCTPPATPILWICTAGYTEPIEVYVYVVCIHKSNGYVLALEVASQNRLHNSFCSQYMTLYMYIVVP